MPHRLASEREISIEGSVSPTQIVGYWKIDGDTGRVIGDFIPNENFVPSAAIRDFPSSETIRITELDVHVDTAIPREQAPFYGQIPFSNDGDIGLVGYIDPNTKEVVVLPGKPNEFQELMENGGTIIGPDGKNR